MPAIYIIAALLLVLFLVGAYRAMGAGASTDEDPKAVLDAVLTRAGEASRDLERQPDAGAPASDAHEVRRRLEGCAQALERITGAHVDDSVDHARTLLEFAVDELTWSSRMMETPAVTRDEAIRMAATALRDSARGNLERARSLLGS